MRITAVTQQAQIAQFKSAMEALGAGYERGVAFALNGVAKDAKARLTKVLLTSIDEPTPFTLRAIQSTFAKLGAGNDIRDLESTVYVLDTQSAYLKYLRGTGVNIRKPGDIGPSDTHIYVPIWQGLKRIGIQPKNGQNLPRNTLSKLAKQAGRPLNVAAGQAEAAAPKSRKRRAASTVHGGVFYGKVTIAGVEQGLGFWARPQKGVKGKPFMLVAAADQSRHRPNLELHWQRALEAAWSAFPRRLEEEIRQKTAHVHAKREKQSQRAAGDPLPDFLTGRP